MKSLATAILLSALVAGGAGAQTPQTPEAPVPEERPVFIADQNAQQTRDELRRLLRQYPPSVSRVLALDPTLLDNQGYLATYPQLAAFLAQQPDIAHNPAYYLGATGDLTEPDPRSQAIRVWGSVMEGATVFLVFAAVTAFLAWLIKTFVDHRRWLHVSKVQTEAHTKLLDRFTSHEDLLAYIQTPAGRRFLEAAPALPDVAPSAVAAPIGRVLWSAQAGMVLTFAGLGLNIVSSRVMDELAPPLVVVGGLAIALGIGFVVSAAVAYVLSRRLGLLEPRTHE